MGALIGALELGAIVGIVYALLTVACASSPEEKVRGSTIGIFSGGCLLILVNLGHAFGVFKLDGLADDGRQYACTPICQKH